MIKLLVYVVSLITSIFAVSGLNINSIFKKNHTLEARLFILILTFSMTYLLANFILDLTNISLI
ncbi:MAG: DUF1146 domain-containing protein [Erysipelotrichales bacterium]|nr:DUF1146 domain-containing protein [Erysipelotrichales bacterium]